METQMNAALLTRKLNKRLKELKEERVKDLAKYDKDFASWKRDLAKWFETELPARVSTLMKGDVDYRGYARFNGLPDRLFKGMPEKPSFPFADNISSIQKTLRFIAVTGEKTVSVSDRDLEAWFGKDGDGE